MNHYYIKAALHKECTSLSSSSSFVFSPFVSPSSTSPPLIQSKRRSDLDDAIYAIESKIPFLEDNVSDEDKIQTLNAVRMVRSYVNVAEESFHICSFDIYALWFPIIIAELRNFTVIFYVIFVSQYYLYFCFYLIFVIILNFIFTFVLFILLTSFLFTFYFLF